MSLILVVGVNPTSLRPPV